jgi:hypothetical protein
MMRNGRPRPEEDEELAIELRSLLTLEGVTVSGRTSFTGGMVIELMLLLWDRVCLFVGRGAWMYESSRIWWLELSTSSVVADAGRLLDEEEEGTRAPGGAMTSRSAVRSGYVESRFGGMLLVVTRLSIQLAAAAAVSAFLTSLRSRGAVACCCSTRG